MRLAALTLAPALVAALPQIGLAQNAPKAFQSYYACAERTTCDAKQRCEQRNTKLFLSFLQDGARGERIFVNGPMIQDAFGGIFFEKQLDETDTPPTIIPQQPMLKSADWVAGGTVWVTRTGRETGFANADWVLVEFSCKQELF